MDRLVARFLGELGALDLVFEFLKFVLAVLVAEFFLDRLHLLVEIIFALGLLHLALDARADALLDLQDRDFAFHQRQHLLEARGNAGELKHRLLVGDLDREMRRDRVGELRMLVDLRDHADHFRRYLLVQLHVVFEFVDDRTRERFDLDMLFGARRKRGRFRFEIFGTVGVLRNVRALDAFDQHLHGAVRQFQELQHGRERADLEDRVGLRLVVARIHLRR